MKKRIVINTDNLKIRTLYPEDINLAYVNGLNDSAVNRFLDTVRRKRQTLKTVNEFVRSNFDSKSDLLLGVFLKESDDMIGTIRLHDITYHHFLCRLGICFFRKEYWGKGYASEALRHVVDFVFKDMGLHYIESGVFEGNDNSVRLFKRAGFKIQTVYEDVYVHEGNFKNVIVFNVSNPLFRLTKEC